MPYRFTELTRDDGYATSDSSEDGSDRCVYQLHGVAAGVPPLVSELPGFASWLCGGVDNLVPKKTRHFSDVHGGKVRRRLPKVHPYKRELSVVGVSSIKGVGAGVAANTLQTVGLDTISAQFWHYESYNYTTEFKRRPYFLIPDEFIERPKRTYVRPDGTSSDVYVAKEEKRYTSTSLSPTPDTVNATTGGQMRFRDAGGGALDGAQYPGTTWVYMENQVLEVMWYLVPYRYFFTTLGKKPYLTRFVNTVNQHELLGFPPGSMLWLGATPTPFQPQSTAVGELFGVAFAQSYDLLCNVKMRWLVTSRIGTNVPVAPDKGLANANNIAAGHNLQPSFTDRKFHYVTTEDPVNPSDQTKWFASFQSFPHELFFTDPMLEQEGAAI